VYILGRSISGGIYSVAAFLGITHHAVLMLLLLPLLLLPLLLLPLPPPPSLLLLLLSYGGLNPCQAWCT